MTLFQKILHESRNVPGCLVLDIDDTIVRADPEVIGIWKTYPDGRTERLSTAEFARDPDSKDLGKSSGCKFDYREFRDTEKITKSILNGTPLIDNLQILDSCVESGWDVVFLTARATEDVIYDVLSDFLKWKDVDGNFHRVKLRREFCAAVNDTLKCYEGATDPEKKGKVLRRICDNYPHVIFVDDDQKNVDFAKSLGFSNLDVIKV